MIPKDKFIKVVKELQVDYAYKEALSDLHIEYHQENVYCFSHTNEGKALSLLLFYALDEKEGLIDTVWDFIFEGKIVFYLGDDKIVVCKTAEELYEELINV